MKSGYTRSWRKELKSDIWQMPPLYHRVWYWLRQKAQYEPYLFPTRKLFGIWVLPGQKLTSIQQIAEGVKYFDNHREIIPDKRTIVRILEWLKFNQCITVTSNDCATLIHIVNWDTYNNNNREPVTDDVLVDVLPHVYKEEVERIKKKEKEVGNKIKRLILIPPTLQEITDYCIERQNKVEPNKFFNYYQSNGWMVGKNKMKDWKAAIRTWETNSNQGHLFTEKPKSFRERVNDAAVKDFVEGNY